MQTAEVTPKFKGKKDEQEIATEAFNVMRATGRFFPKTAPIRASLASLGGYFASTRGERSAEEWQAEVSRIIRLNGGVFVVEEIDDTAYAVTTLEGTPPAAATTDGEHVLAQRFTEPKPAPERPSEPIRRAKVAHISDVAETELIGGPPASIDTADFAEVDLVMPEETAVVPELKRSRPRWRPRRVRGRWSRMWPTSTTTLWER